MKTIAKYIPLMYNKSKWDEQRQTFERFWGTSMRVEADRFGDVASSHLPPVEKSLLLHIANNGRVRAIEKIDTPLTEQRIPDPIKYLEYLSMTLDSTYTPPKQTNVHHLVYPRADYAVFGPDSIQYRYRETASLMIQIPVQVHNYAHWVMNHPKMESYEVMKGVVDEQDETTNLFKIARSIVVAGRWLDSMRYEGVQTYRAAERYLHKHGPTEAMFLDALDMAHDGVFGIMPDRQQLADIGIPAAARQLGVKAAARSLALDREVRTKVRETDIDETLFQRVA